MKVLGWMTASYVHVPCFAEVLVMTIVYCDELTHRCT